MEDNFLRLLHNKSKLKAFNVKEMFALALAGRYKHYKLQTLTLDFMMQWTPSL